MDKLKWCEVVRKTKWASQKKRLGKRELGELMGNVLAIECFMGQNKSDFADANRKEQFRSKWAKSSPAPVNF